MTPHFLSKELNVSPENFLWANSKIFFWPEVPTSQLSCCLASPQPQIKTTRDGNRKSVLTFHSPFPLSTDSAFGPAHTKPVHCPYIYHLACGRRAKHSRGFHQRSVGKSDRFLVRLETVNANHIESSARSSMLPVGSKASFPFCLFERQQNAGKVAHRCTYTGSSVFDRRQKLCESAARLDGLVNLRKRTIGEE